MLRPILVYTLLGYCIYIGVKIYVFTGDIAIGNPLYLWVALMVSSLMISEVLYQKQFNEDGA